MRGVATRMAQVVWPMMIVTVTNFEGFNRQQFIGENVDFGRKLASSAKIHIFGLVKPSKFVGITIIIGHTT